nr:hypothetical protein [Tanacetum cinerariifolium]
MAYIKDVESALNLWANDKQLRLSDDTLLVYVVDLLSIDGYTEHESKISNIFFQIFQSKEYSPQKWVNMLWKYRLFDHTICGSPINDECTKILREKYGSYTDVTFLEKNSESNEVSIGVRNALCLNSTLSCNHDDRMQSDMTDEVKHAVTSLTNDDSSSQTLDSFFAAYMCYDLAQRLIAKGSMSE